MCVCERERRARVTLTLQIIFPSAPLDALFLKCYLSPGQPEAPTPCRFVSSRQEEKRSHTSPTVHTTVVFKSNQTWCKQSHTQKPTLNSSLREAFWVFVFQDCLSPRLAHKLTLTPKDEKRDTSLFLRIRSQDRIKRANLAKSPGVWNKSMKECWDKDCHSEFQR